MGERNALILDDDLRGRRYQLLRADGWLRFYCLGEMGNVRMNLQQGQAHLRSQAKRDIFISEKDIIQWGVYVNDAKQYPMKLLIRTREKRYVFGMLSKKKAELERLLKGIAADSSQQGKHVSAKTLVSTSCRWMECFVGMLTFLAFLAVVVVCVSYQPMLGMACRIAAMVLLLIPLVCMGLFLAFPTGIVFAAPLKRAIGKIDVFWPYLVAESTFLFMEYNITDTLPLAAVIAIFAALVLAVYTLIERKKLKRAVSWSMIIFMLLHCVCGGILANCALDPHLPQVYSGIVRDVERHHSRRNTRYSVSVNSEHGTEDWGIGWDMYEKLRAGDEVLIYVYPGLFGAEHVMIAQP